MTKLRQGFKKAEQDPDWWVDHQYLYWKNPPTEKLLLSDINSMRFKEYDEGKNAPSVPQLDRPNLKEFLKNPDALEQICDKKDFPEIRAEIIEEIAGLSPNECLPMAPIILKSTKWTDAEKIRFIAITYNRMSGFRYGKDANKWLMQAVWSDNSSRNRILQYFDYIKDRKIIEEDKISHDAQIVRNFKSEIEVYRGFNVPIKYAVRSGLINKLWLKQQTGKSIYFSTSIDIAKKFACTQKLYHILNHKNNIKLSPDDKGILQGRLCVAKYRIKIEHIFLFHDKTSRREKEIIASPDHADLIEYNFLGFDDMVQILKKERVL